MGIFRKMSPLGLEKEALGGQAAKKSYVAPTTKVVKFVVEGGFAGSDEPVGSKFYVHSTNRLAQTDPETPGYHWNTAGEGWF